VNSNLYILAQALPSSISQSVLYPAGPESARPYLLVVIFAGLFTLLWLIVVGFLIVGLLRRRTGETATGKPERAVATSGVITAIILFALIIVSSVVGRELYSERAKSNELLIHVKGHQWWWEFQYQNGPVSDFLTTANEIHIPVGRRVRFEVTSDDVIHSFWVPDLAGKIDAIPDHDNSIVFQADTPGTYRGQCAEFCGLQHAHMGLLVVVESSAKFQAWFENQLKPSVDDLTAGQQRGREVFLSSPCVVCHAIRGIDSFGSAAPDLTHLATRTTLASGILPNTPENLGRWITDSQHFKPGTHMPPVDVSSENLRPLVSYLEALK
jgi:cytochrome c oxidase subunit 2